MLLSFLPTALRPFQNEIIQEVVQESHVACIQFTPAAQFVDFSIEENMAGDARWEV